MTRRPTAQEPPEAPFPDDLLQLLQSRGITDVGEVELRRQLEHYASSYTLFRLNPIAARKWKARYRIMLAADYLDCQSVAEAYARGLLASLPETNSTPPAPPTNS